MPNFTDLLNDPTEDVVDDPSLDSTDEPIDEDTTVSDDGDGDSQSDSDADPQADPADNQADGVKDPTPVGDGKTIPQELKDLIKLHPDRAKLLKDLYFTNARYNKFGKIADLQKVKELVDSYGSYEDAQKVKERLDSIGDLDELVNSHQTYEKLDEQFTAGDPAYIDHLAKVNPDAFSKLAPSYLQRFGNDHPQQYNYVMSQVVMSTLINNGTLNDLSLLQQAAQSGNVEQIKAITERIGSQIGAIQALSQKAPALPQAYPRVATLEKESQQLKAERQELFVTDIRERTNTWVSPLITTALKPYGNLKPEMLRRLDRDVKESIGSVLGQNAQFQTKLKTVLSRADRDGALRLYKQFVQPLVNNAARKVAAEYGLKAAAKKPGTPGQPPKPGQPRQPEAGWESVTSYPDPKDVKRDFPEYYEWAEKDRFVLKNGKKVQVVQ